MWKIEDVLSELKEELVESKNEKGLPPGFRFHPTDEELITFYLASKVFNHPLSPTNITTHHSSRNFFPRLAVDITEVDLNRCEPWDLPERARMGEREWYFYSVRDRKYPTGLRTNRATESGYWKATGKDRQVYSNTNNNTTTGGGSSLLIGMKKTLVFYEGRAPRGHKTRWVMHEYRLDGHFSSFRLTSKEEWVICRIFQKSGCPVEHQRKYAPMSTKEHPSSSSQVSPFLSSLPPLLDTPTSASSGLHSLPNSKPCLNNHHDHTNFLLNSLLSNPLTLPALPTLNNYSTSMASHTSAFTPINTLQATSSAAGNTTAIKRDYSDQHWLDKLIPPQIQYHHTGSNYPMLRYEQQLQMDTHSHPSDCYSTGVTASGATVQDDLSASAAALDRLLNHSPLKLSTESWPFPSLCS